jgi:hypothetical protein
MRADDGHLYVVKFQNNPQHVRVLANELIATRLGERVGLPVAHAEIVDVNEWLVQHTPELHMQLAGRTHACVPGLQFGSRYVVRPIEGQALDWLPPSMLDRVRNLEAFLGSLVFDKWTCNADSRQAVFWKRSRDRKYTATFIDHGYCFNAGEWTFPDSPLRGIYVWNDVYITVRGWQSFEPWLSKVEQMPESAIYDIGNEVPPDWYENDWDALDRLLAALVKRRARVRELIWEFRNSSRQPFPKWAEHAVVQ